MIVLSSGHKLPIYLVFKSSSKVTLPDELSPYLVVRNNLSGWVDAQLFEDYVDLTKSDPATKHSSHFCAR